VKFYILDAEGHPQPVPDVEAWAMWRAEHDTRIALTTVGNITISTVFLGIDHNWSNHGPAVLFETMVFGGEHDQKQCRYSTRDYALIGHDKAVALVRAAIVAKEKT
jgi:hypothetical protein